MILCCGEALIDMIPTPTAAGPMGYVPHIGGAIFNTAIALGRLGQQTGMLTGLSDDLFGQQLAEGLTASHVDTSLAIRSDRPTTLAFVKLTDGHATYTFYDENSAGRMITQEDLPTLPDDVSALYFGGISLAVEPGADTYAALLGNTHDSRAVMIDPNIRPGFIRDIERYRVRLEQMVRHSDIVKVSDEDLNWIYPGADSIAQKVARLRELGPAMVIVTRGGAGASAWLADGVEIEVIAKKVDVVDTVGAGDTFNAGVLAMLSELGCLSKAGLRKLAPEDAIQALENGAKVAAITVSRAGANPPWKSEL
ncbi:carbohydrate kinase [Thioclava sp. SK-1]|uniref:carbohydrate kinase family protein n=1 Tax=Thioclava sp. SK-1 TaxID=1889770 RepID=UPI00082690DB|nr:carbohydrate kinase [Thioclava sp. SK-1]OCX66608.1 carbohydrate kinase [Thioclava sp. SK-1]